MHFLIAVISLLPFLLSCGAGDFPKVTVLGDLRILSLKLDKPEASPGDSVTVTPFISDLNGAGRSLTYSVSACSDPGLVSGADPTCDGKSDKVTVVSSTTITGLSASVYTGPVSNFSVTVPTTVLANRSAVDQANGISYLIFYTITAPDGKIVTALKRVLVSTQTTKNTNPTISAILSDGTALTALPSSKVTLTTTIAGTSKETYTLTYQDGTQVTKTENLILSWFITDGEIQYSETNNAIGNEWTPPIAAPVGRSAALVIIVRDQRGGEDSVIVKLP